MEGGAKEGKIKEGKMRARRPLRGIASPLSLSLPLWPLFISFSLALSSPVYAGERLPILRQGQDRDFNQLAGFLGPGK